MKLISRSVITSVAVTSLISTGLAADRQAVIDSVVTVHYPAVVPKLRTDKFTFRDATGKESSVEGVLAFPVPVDGGATAPKLPPEVILAAPSGEERNQLMLEVDQLRRAIKAEEQKVSDTSTKLTDAPKIMLQGPIGNELVLARDRFVRKTEWSTSSGFRFGDDGHVMTFLDPVSPDMEGIFVRDEEGDWKATIVAFDTWSGLTVLNVADPEAKEKPAATLASGMGEIGDEVWTVYEHRHRVPTLARGVIATESHFDSALKTFVQLTDITVAAGSAGGPVLNNQNEVVGVLKGMTSTDGRRGDGIAMSAQVLQYLTRQVQDGVTGRLPTALLGVALNMPVVNNSLDGDHRPIPVGATVTQVVPGSAAEKAGLKPEDVIVSVNDYRADRVEDVIGTIRYLRPGSTVRLIVVREGKEMTFDIELDERKKIAGAGSPKVKLSKTSEDLLQRIEKSLADDVELTDEAREKLREAVVEAQQMARKGSVFVYRPVPASGYRSPPASGPYRRLPVSGQPTPGVTVAPKDKATRIADLQRQLEVARKLLEETRKELSSLNK